jgi:ADP-heptose:LPS heptosyltransferase
MIVNAWTTARNLLAVRLDNAGDVIMLGPALRAVQASAPETRLTLVATPAGTAAAELLPWIDDVITWRPVWQDLGQSSCDPDRDRMLVSMLADREFDGALIFTSFSQTPHVPGYVCYLAGIPLRAGESKEFGGATLTDELRSCSDDLHQVERNLRLVESLGFTVQDRRLSIAIPAGSRATAQSLLARLGIDPGTPFVLVHPGASVRARRLPPDRLTPAIQCLREKGVTILVTGSEREREFVMRIGQDAGVPTLAGGTTLPELAALIESAGVVLCGNTLPLHLADAVGTPLVVLYSGTDLVSQWRPRTAAHQILRRDTACTPCYLFDCPIDQLCLDLPTSEITDAVLDLLALSRDRRETAPINTEAAR